MKFRYIKLLMLVSGIVAISSCKKMMDINKDPDRLPTEGNRPYPQLLTSAQVNLGFEGGSDLFRYATLIMQQMSGGASQPNQTYEYYRHNITGSDINNVWSSIFATTLSDLELIIKQGSTLGSISPYYTGIAKILKAYEYSLVVDVWGDVPYSEAQKLTDNIKPVYDDDATIYPKLITLLAEAVSELNAPSSLLTPGSNSVIYTGTYSTIKTNWIKLANTLRLRLLLHYSKKDPTFCVQQITALINAGGPFMTSNADNFKLNFYDVANQRNAISAFEVSRPGYLYADRFMTEKMDAKSDPRRPFYFAIFPFDFAAFNRTTNAISSGNSLTFASTSTGITTGMTVVAVGIPSYTIVKSVAVNTTSGITTITVNDDESPGFSIASIPSGTSITFQPAYRGAAATKPPITANGNYSRIHTFLRGAVTNGATAPAGYTGLVQPFTYTGAAPQRMFSFAEYNFIRAEAALMGAPGDAQTFFTAGIIASMEEAGVAAVDITNYITANGTLNGTNAQKLRQIIEEKYIASFGVSVEPWNDWKRTGYPVLPLPSNSITGAIPRTLFYAQTELDLNPNNPGQKASNLQSSVFWDN